MDLQGVAALVTGGGSGMGEAAARAIAARGAHVVVIDLPHSRGADVAEQIDGRFVPGDVRNEADVLEAVRTGSAAGPLRVLVNCAGIGGPRRTIGKDGQMSSAHPLDLFQTVLSVNLVGTFNCIRLAATAMSATDPLPDGSRGSILNTSSVAAFEGQVGQASYAASKAGIVGMTLPIARDLAVAGIRVNTLAPGLIDTPMWGAGEASDQAKDVMARSVLYPPRLGSPEEFASLAVETLCNDYMNAQVIRLDGGARLAARP